MEIPNEVVALVVTALAGGGGFAARRWSNGNGRHAAAAEGTERRQGQSELIAAVREGTRATREEASKSQSGITALAKEQAELVGYLKAKI